MEHDKINNLLLSEDNESEKLSKFATREYIRVIIENIIVYLIRITKINQLYLKHPCQGQTYVIILMRIY